MLLSHVSLRHSMPGIPWQEGSTGSTPSFSRKTSSITTCAPRYKGGKRKKKPLSLSISLTHTLASRSLTQVPSSRALVFFHLGLSVFPLLEAPSALRPHPHSEGESESTTVSEGEERRLSGKEECISQLRSLAQLFEVGGGGERLPFPFSLPVSPFLLSLLFFIGWRRAEEGV